VAVPGAGTNVPIWLLGSSLFSAQLAAERGLPYAFASHFAPRWLHQAIERYRSHFRPSAALARPYVMIGVPLIAAPTDAEAEFLASSIYQRVLGILRGDRRRLPAPVPDFAAGLDPQERVAIEEFLAEAVIGGPQKVRAGLLALAQATAADELMLVCDIFDPALRLRSLDIVAAALAD
jgi:luciferase family oxidoreductase group 1